MMDPEKARLQAEAKAAEDARMRVEAEAAAEIRRKRELEREAARQALLQASEHIIYCMYTALFVLGFVISNNIFWHSCRWKRLLKSMITLGFSKT